MTALTPENCWRHMIVAHKIVGPRSDVLDSKSRSGSWAPEELDGESGRRGESDVCELLLGPAKET